MGDSTVFLHLSDIHMLPGDEELLGSCPARNLRRTIAHILALPIAPQFCLITGDLAQDGAVASYAHLRQQLAPLRERAIPIIACLGNHDRRAAFREGFLGVEASDERYFTSQQVGDLRVIALDSLIPGADDGELGAAQLRWLTEALAAPAPGGTIVALHHSAAPSGWGPLQSAPLRDAAALRAILAAQPPLAVLAGHVHTASATLLDGALYSTAPAIVFQLATGATEMVLAPGSGFNLCVVREGTLVVNAIMA